MRHSKKDRILSIALVSPSIIAMFIFIYGFIGFTAYSSLSNWNKMKPDFTFVGLANYTRLFQSERFIIDMRNT
ncbi:MAG: sugar ABC transporter permease, partial [Candidatus Thorarchaeota archaeon]|nr:sugar ABC transporter permease [Candidatus Thorarchaeota archaeon]